MFLLLALNFASVLIWLLILAIFLAVVWMIITKLVPAEFQSWAKLIVIVIVAVMVIYWLSELAPNPFR